MHIVFIVNDHPPEAIAGGIVTYTRHMALAWQRAGHDVTVVAWSKSGNRLVGVVDGVRVIRVVPKDYDRSIVDKIRWRLTSDNSMRMIHHRAFAHAVADEIETWIAQPDLIESPEVFGWAEIVIERKLAPVVIRVHGPNYLAASAAPSSESLQAASVDAAELNCLKNAQMVVPITGQIKSEIEKLGANCSVSVGLPLDINLDPVQIRKKRIIVVGRMIPGKGFATAINVLAGLSGDWTAAFVGPGESGYKAELQKMAENFGIHRRIEFLGELSYERVLEEMAVSTVLIHDSANDNMPYVVLEALALDVAVIASNVGGIPETLAGHGLCVDLGDVKAYVEAIEKLKIQTSSSAIRDRHNPARLQILLESMYGPLVNICDRVTRMAWWCQTCKLTRCKCSQSKVDSDILDFRGSLSELVEDQAQLHDCKGGHINPWPEIPVTALQAQRMKWVDRLVDVEPGHVLEIGCHRSGLLHKFHHAGWKIYGIDVSGESIRDQDRLLPGCFTAAMAEKIPLANQSMDLVIAAHVLEHVSDIDKAIDEVKRVLRPSGIFHIEIPLKDVGLSLDGWRLWRDRENWIEGAKAAGHEWNRLPVSHEFIRTLECAGFVIDTVERGSIVAGPLWDQFIVNLGSLGKRAPQNNHLITPTVTRPTEIPRRLKTTVNLKRRLLSIPARFLSGLEHGLIGRGRSGATLFIRARNSG